MAVLARDIEAYQRAVDTYRRQLGAYNAQIAGYNNSVASTNDQPLVAQQNGVIFAVNPDGSLGSPVGTMGDGTYSYDQYGVTPIEGSSFSLVRQNPTSSSVETKNNVYASADPESGAITYYTYDDQNGMQYLGPEWKPVGPPTADESGAGVYTMQRTAFVFPDKPGDFTAELKAKKPDPTNAQLRKLGQPSLAEQERGGLISEVFRSGGLKGGSGRTQGGKPTDLPSDPPATDPVVTDPFDWGTMFPDQGTG